MPQPEETQTGPDGQLRKWQPDTRNLEAFNYLGPASGFSSVEDAAQADADSGQGSWVPAAYSGGMPWWMKAFVATGLGAAAVTGLGALAAPGAFGAGGGSAAAGAGSAATGAATGAGAAGAGAVPTSIGVGAASPSSLLAASGAPSLAMSAAPTAAGGGGGLAGLFKDGTLGKLGGVGQVLSGYAQGAAQGRQAEANLNLGTDTLRQRQAEDERQNAIQRGTLEVTQKKTGQDLESQARRQAALGLYQKNGPVTIAPPANIASHMGTIGNVPDFSSVGSQAYDDAMKRLLSGSDKQFTPQPNIPTPTLTPQPNEGWLDKLMRWGGTGAGVVGALGGYRPPTTGGR